MPVISVIIPVYNGEKTIKDTIESISNQTFSDFEIIVINDGSQDSSLEIIYRISEPRLKVFSYPNAGLSASRNRGISKASGEYISFIDADDCWTPDKLEAQLKALQANPKAAVAYSWTNHVNEVGQFLHQGSYITAEGNVYANLLLVNFLESGSNPLIRKQALAEVGCFDESVNPLEDWDMWLRLAARYEFVCVQSPQILYRVSPNSMSSDIFKWDRSGLQVVKRCFAEAPESIQPLKRVVLANRYKNLTFSALQRAVSRERGLIAVKFLLQAVKNDPSLLRRRVFVKILLRIVVMVLLPPQQAKILLTKSQRLFNINPLLSYRQLEPPPNLK